MCGFGLMVKPTYNNLLYYTDWIKVWPLDGVRPEKIK